MGTTKIKCPVEGVIEMDRLPGVPTTRVERIIDAPELQRLRRIKQLGFTELVYPGATHTRFAHSLGAFQGAQRTLIQLRRSGADIPDDWFAATALACLLHDLGHGPFSHTFESVTGVSHEARTREILESGPVIPDALEEIAPGMAGRVLDLVRGEVAEPALRFLPDLVSSALDCDRMDYLRRDAQATGATYGLFDRDWLIREMVVTPEGDAVVVVEKGRSAVEQYLIGRYHMFQNVYLHKTSRGFETAFRGLCRRILALGPSHAPGPAFAALFAEQIPLETFLQLSDLTFQYEIAQLVDHSDPTLRALARALHFREPLRHRTTTEGAADLDAEHARRTREATDHGLDPDTAVWRDEAGDVPYRPYAPAAGRKGLRILDSDGSLVDITRKSPTIAALSTRVAVHRLYWVPTGAEAASLC